MALFEKRDKKRVAIEKEYIALLKKEEQFNQKALKAQSPHWKAELEKKLLKGIYQTAIGYGFTYDSTEERLFILRMMEAALMRNSDFEEKNAQVDNMIEGITLIGEKDLEKQLHRSSWRRCQSNLL